MADKNDGTMLIPWLDVPGPDFSDDGLPDPYRTIGGHITVTYMAGIPVGHGEWTRTHAGQCPPGCTKLPEVPHADPSARSPAWDVWAAFLRGMPRLPIGPVEQSETGVTLRNKGGWNQYSCVPPDGDPYA